MYSMLSDSNFDVLYVYTVTKVAGSELEMFHVKHTPYERFVHISYWLFSYRRFLSIMRFVRLFHVEQCIKYV